MVCGSVWVCPFCASKIIEQRRFELQSAIKAQFAAGGHCTMITLSFIHSANDKLNDLLDALKGALMRFRSGRSYNRFKLTLSLIGSIRALEVTYGGNGWHPQIHLLLFHQNEIESWESFILEDEIYAMWSTACRAYGLLCNRKHGVRFHNSRSMSAYIDKYGILTEKQRITESGITAFDMLKEIVETGDLTNAEKYREYVSATNGKKQLVWSRGLKEFFGL
nr:protein rep [Paenibacillus roseus]